MRLSTAPIETQLGNKALYRDIATKKTQNGAVQTAYYSSIDAEIYFGDTYVDEVAQIQFQVQQNVMPLIGYNSYTYDELAVGSRIVSGSFAINFTKSRYLYDILDALSDSIVSSKKAPIKTNESTVQNFDANQLVTNAQSNSSLLASKSPLFAQRHSPILNKTFDIVLSYGDSVTTKSRYSTTVTLAGVQITGCQQQLTFEGEPVMEIYTFIANDMYTTPNLSEDIASGTSAQDILNQYEPSVPKFSDFTYNEEESIENYEKVTYGVLKFTNQSPKDISIEKVLIEAKSLGVNTTKEIPIGDDKSNFVYTVTDDIKNAVHQRKTDFKLRVYCQYKNDAGKLSTYDAGEYTVKTGTIVNN
jgi:hypothetical protein